MAVGDVACRVERVEARPLDAGRTGCRNKPKANHARGGGNAITRKIA